MKFSPLRSQLLQLAISGKLIEQSDSEPEVAQLGPAPASDEVPFALPPKWKWVQLKFLGDTLTGKTPPTSHPEYFGHDIPFITPGDIDEKCNVIYTNRGISLIAKRVIKTTPAETVFMVCIGGSIGKCGMATKEIAFNQQLNAILPNRTVVLPIYLLNVFTSSCFQSQLQSKAKGTASPIVNKNEWSSLLIPLPPLEEQQRIVAIVDELMSTLDRIEEAYGEFEGPMTEHFRNSALQKAMQGQLVPQLDTEPEVAQLGLAPAPDEVPFAIPPKWKWVQIGALLPFGGSSNQVKPEQIPANSWLLGLEEIASNGDLIKKIRDWDSVGSTKNAFKAGDVLYSKMRPYLNKVIIADEPGFCSTELIVLDVGQAKAPLLADYLLCFLRSPYFVSYATTHSHGQKPRLDLELGKQAWMPLPPLEEQRRIVAKLEELFTGVEQLKSLVEFAKGKPRD